MALTMINVESWESVSEARQAWICRRLKEACEQGRIDRSQIQYGITDKSIIYTFRPTGSGLIESSLGVDLEPTDIRWVDFNGAKVFVLAHMMVLSHMFSDCRFTVDADRGHSKYLRQAYDIARGAMPELPVPAWLDQLEPLDGSSIVRPDWLDFSR